MAESVNRFAIKATITRFTKKKDDFHGQMGELMREEIIGFAKTLGALEVSDEAKAKAFASMVETMRASLTTKHDIDAFVAAMFALEGDTASGAFDGDLGDTFLETFQAALDGHTAKVKAPDVECEQQLKTLKKVGRAYGGDDGADESDDEEVRVDEAQETGEAALKDPLTTALLEEPVVSKKCGHSFSKATVTKYFKGAGKKCPVFGCNQHLAVADFKRDHAKEVALKELKKKKARANQSQRNATQDVDMEEESD